MKLEYILVIESHVFDKHLSSSVSHSTCSAGNNKVIFSGNHTEFFEHTLGKSTLESFPLLTWSSKVEVDFDLCVSSLEKFKLSPKENVLLGLVSCE